MTHPWHSVHFGKQAPEIVTGLIEIPRGSKAKYEIDKASGLIKLDRVLFSSVHYPANYGFIPQTLAGDNDPLDILVFCQIDLPPRTLVDAKVLGVMRMRDKNETDDKIIAVALHDISMVEINTIDELPKHTLLEMSLFFEDYKKLERKNTEIVIEGFLDKTAAYAIIQESIACYKENRDTLIKKTSIVTLLY